MNNIVRIIPRIDVKGPNVVKGLQFDGFRVLGTAEEFSEIYYNEGADELIYSDTVASLYQRNSFLDVIRRIANKIFIPLTVAGGLRSLDDIKQVLRAGADKVAINTAAVKTPELLKQAVKAFGSQCVVSSIEAYRHENGQYEIWVDYGRQPTGIDVFDWIKRVLKLGVGEILVTSINNEGMGNGYDIELISKISSLVSVPVIACGGAGQKKDFVNAVKGGSASAVCAASVFHYYYVTPKKSLWMSFNEPRLRMGEQMDSGNIDFLNFGYGNFKDIMVTPLSISEVKEFMRRQGIPVRLNSSHVFKTLSDQRSERINL